jgi:hypothetical protein
VNAFLAFLPAKPFSGRENLWEKRVIQLGYKREKYTLAIYFQPSGPGMSNTQAKP